MRPTLAFDIETVPDVAGLRALHGMPHGLSDQDVAELAFQRRRAQTGGDFLPVHLHRVVAIACVLGDASGVRVWSLGSPEDDERTLIQHFFAGIDQLSPQLVSWNGSGFDLPVLSYRGLICGVQAPRFWELGDTDRDFRDNNYISRDHTRHLDLMALLGFHQPRNNVSLDDAARLMGFPGKLGMDGSQVWQAFCAGRIAQIRAYCETDALNTYLIHLRFQRMRGMLDEAQYRSCIGQLRHRLASQAEAHWTEFLAAWPENDAAPS